MQTRKKILVVDDDPNVIAIAKELLDEDYNLKTATTGEEALKIARDFIPDLIILDIMMPGMDGYEVCRRLREQSILLDVQIIMVSSKGELEDRIKGQEMGADDYITKPFEEEDLLESVSFFLNTPPQVNTD
jgi:two-component system alkaline phosphatase synthesis response regulator PhoP